MQCLIAHAESSTLPAVGEKSASPLSYGKNTALRYCPMRVGSLR
jgi:hypothetical protein